MKSPNLGEKKPGWNRPQIYQKTTQIFREPSQFSSRNLHIRGLGMALLCLDVQCINKEVKDIGPFLDNNDLRSIM